MKRITFARRDRRYPGVWHLPETVVLSAEGARRFLRDARRSSDFHILKVRPA